VYFGRTDISRRGKYRLDQHSIEPEVQAPIDVTTFKFYVMHLVRPSDNNYSSLLSRCSIVEPWLLGGSLSGCLFREVSVLKDST
jgi:hypothetical protein